MARYASTIFLGAFLVFLVQPLIGKVILPWYGGGPSVWTVCMLFFQVLLLAGYLYAHWLAGRPRVFQGFVHAGVLIASLITLPILPDANWRPTPDVHPTWAILLLLLRHVGAPFLLLAATGPLLQRWFSEERPGRSPYRLYALSNLASLSALLLYPVAFEPMLRLADQANLWTTVYLAFVALCAFLSMKFALGRVVEVNAADAREVERLATFVEGGDKPPRPAHYALWLVLSAIGSVMLLATTNRMSQEIASIPLLWILPLAMYLATFIVCFDRDKWYRRWLFAPLVFVCAAAVLYVIYYPSLLGIRNQIALFLLTLVVVCMVCHGELARSRPAPRYLTAFYLTISTGGALGGVFVALVAPLLFRGYWEYHLCLVAAAVLAVFALRHSWPVRIRPQYKRPVLTGGAVLCVAVAASFTIETVDYQMRAVDSSRSFFGTLRVVEHTDEFGRPIRVLLHGSTEHGAQYLDPRLAGQPTTYYGSGSGVSVALKHFTREGQRGKAGPLRIGVVGLGAGTVGCYARRGDYMRFYEIDPGVIKMADKHFNFIADGVGVDYVLGDARVTMQRELEAGQPQRFDVLILDAFTSDAIPMHLLTREALDVYMQHLRPDGVIAFHVSNQHVDLAGVVRGLADHHRLSAIRVLSDAHPMQATYSADWVLLTRNQRFAESKPVFAAATPWREDDAQPVLWTDDHASLWSAIDFGTTRTANPTGG